MEMMVMFGSISCGVIILMGVMGVLIFLLVRWMGALFGTASGWDELARRFPGPVNPPASLQKGGFIRLGNVFYRFGIQTAVLPEGLYLVFKGAYSYPPILLPWSEMKNPQSSLLYWQPARRLDIGQPLIVKMTVMEPLYQAMKPYLEAVNKSRL
jgi:hypothetical protein